MLGAFFLLLELFRMTWLVLDKIDCQQQLIKDQTRLTSLEYGSWSHCCFQSGNNVQVDCNLATLGILPFNKITRHNHYQHNTLDFCLPSWSVVIAVKIRLARALAGVPRLPFGNVGVETPLKAVKGVLEEVGLLVLDLGLLLHWLQGLPGVQNGLQVNTGTGGRSVALLGRLGLSRCLWSGLCLGGRTDWGGWIGRRKRGRGRRWRCGREVGRLLGFLSHNDRRTLLLRLV